MQVPLIDLKLQYTTIQEEIRSALTPVFESQVFTLGPQLQAFEEEVAEYCGTRFAIGVASGTDALTLSLKALGIGPGDEVIVPAFTFVATAGSVALLGATPVFADIRRDTFTLDVGSVVEMLTGRTRAVIPVHLYGQSAEMDPLVEVARRHKLLVVEDNAQAIGATYKGSKTGAIGHAGCLSFYPSKNLGAWGDAGMVVTDSETVAIRLRSLRDHGTVQKYVSREVGWNSRLDEIQAAVLRVKLRHLQDWIRKRQAHAAMHDSGISGIDGVVTPRIGGWGEHVYHQYTIRVPNRDRVRHELARLGVSSGVYYPVPLHLQPAFASRQQHCFPESERAAWEVLSLPIYPELKHQQIEYVARSLKHALSAKG